jgi:hypothetical protein
MPASHLSSLYILVHFLCKMSESSAPNMILSFFCVFKDRYVSPIIFLPKNLLFGIECIISNVACLDGWWSSVVLCIQ